MRVEQSREDGTIHAFSHEDFATMSTREPHNIFVIAMTERKGVGEFVQEVEWSHFRPHTPANAELECYLAQFPDDGILWIVLKFPQEYIEEVRQIAKRKTFVLRPGIPRYILLAPTGHCIITASPNSVPEETSCFPLAYNSNVYTIEFEPKAP